MMYTRTWEVGDSVAYANCLACGGKTWVGGACTRTHTRRELRKFVKEGGLTFTSEEMDGISENFY
jgi:hypothetical protein